MAQGPFEEAPAPKRKETVEMRQYMYTEGGNIKWIFNVDPSQSVTYDRSYRASVTAAEDIQVLDEEGEKTVTIAKIGAFQSPQFTGFQLRTADNRIPEIEYLVYIPPTPAASTTDYVFISFLVSYTCPKNAEFDKNKFIVRDPNSQYTGFDFTVNKKNAQSVVLAGCMIIPGSKPGQYVEFQYGFKATTLLDIAVTMISTITLSTFSMFATDRVLTQMTAYTLRTASSEPTLSTHQADGRTDGLPVEKCSSFDSLHSV